MEVQHRQTLPFLKKIQRPETRVRIKGDQIICEGKAPHLNSAVNIEDLQYAYISIDRAQIAYLYLSDLHSHYLPVNASGFKQAYEFLSTKYGFDDATFFKQLDKEGSFRKEIWRIKNSQNYKVLDQAAGTDYAIGFEIQSPDKEQISWDTTC